MKLLQFMTFYPNYTQSFYDGRPGLATEPFSRQIAALLGDGFAGGHVLAPDLARLGYDAQLIVHDCAPAQFQWARENGVTVAPDDPRWTARIVAAQVEKLRPDVVYITDPVCFDWGFFSSLSWRPRLVVIWRAAMIPPWINWAGFDAIVSNDKGSIDQALALGVPFAERMNPGFPAFMAERLRAVEPECDVAFTGQLSRWHLRRVKYLAHVGATALQGPRRFSVRYHLPFGDPAGLPAAIGAHHRPAVWGEEMFRAVKQARIVVNPHIDIVDGVSFLGNMRVFETTGMGTLMLADGGDDPDPPFIPGVEVATYRGPHDLVEKIHYYLDHPEEREAIARRGQERCLRDHSTARRAEEFDAIIRRLEARKSVDGQGVQRRRLEKAGAGLQPADLDAVCAMAERAVAVNALPAAEAQLNLVLAVAPGHVRALLLLSAAKARSGRIDEAVALCHAALAANAQDWSPYAQLSALFEACGKPAEALDACRQALTRNLGSAELHARFGRLLTAKGEIEAGLKHLAQAAALAPDHAPWRAALAEALVRLARIDEARAALARPAAPPPLTPAGRIADARRLAALAPDAAPAWLNLAVALQGGGLHAAAVEAYDKALRLQPDTAAALFNRAVLQQGLGRKARALADCRAATLVDPGFAPALVNGGALARDADDGATARRWLRRATLIRPDIAEAWINLTLAVHADQAMTPPQRDAAAAALSRRALVLAPASVDALANLAVAAQNADPTLTLRLYERARALRPDHPETLANMATSALAAGRDEAAEQLYARALALRPAYAEGWRNLGCAELERERFAVAKARFRRATLADPTNHAAGKNLGMTALLLGDYAAGWPAYEARLADAKNFPRRFNLPQWTGEPLNGRRIVLHAEQGFGDFLQFVRYAPLAVRAGGRVTLETPQPLATLMRSLPLADAMTIVERGAPLPACDLQCPIMSLPHAFKTTAADIPADIPYLAADPAAAARWAERLGPRKPDERLRVGFIWAGSATFEKDALRSPRLAALRPVLDTPGVRFIALQKGDGRRDLAGADLPPSFTDVGDALNDFADTAAVMANLDLVISSCTGPAHLAAAMGIPTWIIVPRVPDWRWLLEREDSPWYPSVRLFRQARAGEWAETAARVAAALRDWRPK